MSQLEWSQPESESRLVRISHALVSKIGFVFMAGLTAVCVIAVTSNVTDGGTKRAYMALVLGFMAWAAFLYKRPKEVFLFGFLFSLTYNRQFFVLQGWANSGMQGPYIIVADIFLLALFATWLYESAVLKIPSKPLGGRLWPWYVPFAAACILSLFVAARMDWTAFELIRVLKVGLLLWYCRYNLKRREWWICAAGIGTALSAQSVLGILEVTFKKSGVMWLFGGGTAENIVPEAFSEEAFYGFRRATATMNHPPNLACYLLLTIPLVAALGLTHSDRRWRYVSALATLLGLTCLGCTMSRWPWALMVGMLAILIVGLAWLRCITIKRAIAVIALAGVVGSGVGLILADRIYERFTGDFSKSVEQRKKGNQAALDMLVDNNVLLGVGLNNYRIHMLKYEPEAAWVDENEFIAVQSHLRFIAGPLNGFLLVLSEEGVLGLTTWLIYVFGITIVAFRAISITTGYRRAAMLGLLIGFAGVIAQEAVDYSYWVDPILYTATIIVGMLNCARSVEGSPPEQCLIAH